ncbi:MAG: ATP-dependent DNA helicase [Pseudomonadales bacterium]|jgi:DNA excision repair protein ERCC-2|nr:ATP-dependent DNA helicase [Pseudomonadales bacterium]
MALTANKAAFKISVRDLVEQVERSGDINFRFSTRSSALAGLRGHQRVQKSRGEDYVAEKKLTDLVERGELVLQVSGRVDGYFPQQQPMLVEEIKTTRSRADMIPASVRSLHWGQARVYAWLLARDHGLAADENIEVRLCYLQLDDDSEYLLSSTWTVAALAGYYQQLVDRYVAFLQGLARWQTVRDASITAMVFPYPQYRSGQRDMAVSIYRAMHAGTQLILQAPTGIGKTMGALFPAIKALSAATYDKLFFVSAKTSGHQVAARAVADLRSAGLQLRDITLTAKDKICFTPGAPCDAEHCQYALGYYDKLAAVMAEVMADNQSLDRSYIEAKARAHQLCPFELELDLSLLADVVICDYNYVFDPAVYLRRYFDNPEQRYGLLIDEAHNLVDRGRDMFSADISKDQLLDLKRQLQLHLPDVARSLGAANNQIMALLRPLRATFDQTGAVQCSEPPEKLLQALRRFSSAAETWLQQNQEAPFATSLLQVYFASLRFIRIAEAYDKHYTCLVLQQRGGIVVKLYNINPGPGLATALSRVRSVVGFSATLMPQAYFQTLMGIAVDARWYQIESPFDPANLGVFSTSYISTTYRDRGNSLYELVDTIATVIEQQAGNYLVFLPSFYYLDEVREKFVERYAAVPCVTQTPGMDEQARQDFLQQFDDCSAEENVSADKHRKTLVGFAVMGGVFGEGIDLKGKRLIGVIIAGVGLPQLGIERDVIKDYFEQSGSSGQGFEFAYQYPGMNRVLQAAGRVIRSDTDRGIICLIDNRFNESRYRQLMPAGWQVKTARNRDMLARAVAAFWDPPSVGLIPSDV